MSLLNRKLVFNFLATFFMIPLILEIKYWIDFNINPFLKYESLIEYFKTDPVITSIYFYYTFISLFFLIIPFQLTKDYFYERGRKLNFAGRYLCLFIPSFLILIVFGFLVNAWTIDKWLNNLTISVCYLSLFVLIITWFLYLTIDRYVEKRKKGG